MASYMSSIIDVLVTDVLEYLGGPVSPSTAGSAPPAGDANKAAQMYLIPHLTDAPTKPKQKSAASSYSNVSGYAVISAVVALLLMLILCRRCHRRKRARVAFTGVPNHGQSTGMSSCRRIHVASLMVQSKYRPVESGNFVIRHCKGDSESCETQELQPKFMVPSLSDNTSNESEAKEPQPDVDSGRVKEGVKRKLEEGMGSVTATGKKNSQYISQKLPKEPPKRQYQHAYTYASPHRKEPEVAKSANTASYQSDDFKTRWKGSIPKSRLNKIRCRYAREALQSASKKNSAQPRDSHLRKQRNMNHGASATLHPSSHSSPFSKPVHPHPAQSPQLCSRNAHLKSSPEKRKRIKRSKTLTAAAADDVSGVVNFKAAFQKEKDSYRTNQGCTTFSKNKDRLGTRLTQKSPKKPKKSSVLLKGKKLSGQRKAKKARKKHKFKENMKSMRIAIEKVTFPERRVPENYCNFPEAYRGVHVPAVVRQASTKGTKTESFTIKRTATPVLSSLLGQGAFRTCWPQSEHKSVVYMQEHDGNGNTGRHNTNFLGPKLPDCNNETSEGTNYSRARNNQFWNNCKCDFNPPEGRGKTADVATHKGFVFTGKANPQNNFFFHFPNLQTSREHPLETKGCRDAFTAENNKETSTMCQNSRLGETKMSNVIKKSYSQRNEQLCASSHPEPPKQQTDCWNSSSKLKFTAAIPTDDLRQEGGMPANATTQVAKARIKGHGQTNKKSEWDLASHRPHVSSNRNRSGVRPEGWTHGDKQVHKSNQQTDTNIKLYRQDLRKRCPNHNIQCPQQCQCISFVTGHPENRQAHSNADNMVCDKQFKTDVKQFTHNTNHPDAKLCFQNTDKSYAAALPRCSDNANPLDVKEFRNLWETKITHEGNVFRLTRNHTLPSRVTYDDSQLLQEATNSEARRELRQNTSDWPDSEDKTSTLQQRSEGKKLCSIKAVGLCKDVNHECSKPLDKIHAQRRICPVDEEMQVVSRVHRQDGHVCWEKQQEETPDARNAEKAIPRQGKGSKVQDDQSIPANSPTAEEWPDFGIHVYDRLNQSSSSVPSTVDEASGPESESLTDLNDEVKGQSTHSKHLAYTHCFQKQAEKQMYENSCRCDCRQHHPVALQGRDENDATDHDDQHDVKYHKHKPTEKPTGKTSVVHGHVVKRNKSLISVRNMLNELTSHLRASHENNYPAVQTHVRKPRGKTLYYFKPADLAGNVPQSHKEDDINSVHKTMHSHAHRCSNAAEGTADSHGREKYVKCYRSRKFKVYRHEPYRKRVPTSSDSTVTPSSGYYWTRNKNNCSPSRKGRYVLGPLVDKHVFTEEQNNADMGAVEGSGSNSITGQQDNRDTVSVGVVQNTQRQGKMTLDNTNIKQVETEHSDVEQETKGFENMAFTTPVFPKTRPVPEENTDKEHVDLWNYGEKDLAQTRHACAWPAAVEAQPADDVSKTGRATRGHTNAGHKIPAETRYQIIRQYCGVFPEASHTIKRHIPTGHATKGDTTAGQIMKVCTAKRNVCKGNIFVEGIDKKNSHRDRTSERHTDMVHIVRHNNPTDPTGETNARTEDTHTEQKETEDGTPKRKCTGQLVIRQNFLKQETTNNYVKDTTTKKSAAGISSKKVYDVTTEGGCSLDRPTVGKHTTKQAVDVEYDHKDHHSTAVDHDKKKGQVFCSENYPKSQDSLDTGKKHDHQHSERYPQCKPNTLDTPGFSQTKAGETGANESTTQGRDKTVCLRAAETSETKSKVTALRAGCSRQQFSRLNIMKTQGCLARLKASHGPLSQRCLGPFDRNKSSRAGRLQQKNNKIPATQSHTTQTENCINSAHVGVQTSPGLQVATRRTPRHSKMRRYVINQRLCRDKVTPKEGLLSKHKLHRKPSANALNSFPTSASQVVQISTHEYSINRNQDAQNETVLEGHVGASEKQNMILAQTVKENDCEQLPAARGFTDLSNDPKITSFENRSRNDMASNSEKLQDIRLSEKRNIRANFGTDNEFSDRKVSSQDVETNGDNKRRDDKQTERTFIPEFPNAQFSGTQNTGYHDAKALPNVDSKEKEKCSVSQISYHTDKDMKTSEVSNEREFSTAAVNPRSNRIRALASSDSSALSSRLSELSKFCVIRPIWKNANVEEIDRRVRRALKLREELKQSGTSGSRARSLITSYFEASAAENTGRSSDGMRSGASSTFASDFDSTNRSTYPMSRDQRTSIQDTGSDDTLCQKGEYKPVNGGRSSSSEDNRTKQGDEVSGIALNETTQPGTSLRWVHRQMESAAATEQKTHENLDNEQRPEVHSRTEYPLSLHEETASESVSRVERPSSTMASHRPRNSNSGNSIKRAAMKNKNSPPTKISKVENVSDNTPRLVGALVQTLPQVPLTSFVEWFIETSDPNNFLPSDRPSSSSDNSPGDSAHCGFDDGGNPADDPGSSRMWQTILFNKPHASDAVSSKNKYSRPLSTASHRQANFQDNPTSNQSEDHIPFLDGAKPKCYQGDCLPVSWKSKMPHSISSAFPSTPSSATYGMSTLSGDTEARSDLTRNTGAENKRQKSFLEAVKEVNIQNYPLKPRGEENVSDTIMKELCTKLASKRKTENNVSVSNIKPNESRQISTSSIQQHNLPNEELTTPDSFSGNISFQRADSCTFSYPVSKTSLQYVAHTDGDASSGQIGSESTEENAYPCKSKHDKTARPDSGAARNRDNATDSSRISRTREEHTETQASVGSDCTSEQGDVNERQMTRDTDEDTRCAPGIRHILMKLRQTADFDELPVPRAERTKITLRKCSDVTGIIARFQNTQP